MAIGNEKTSSVLADIHNVIVSVAIIAGGIWTLITFSALKSKQKAEAELSQLQLSLEKTKTDLFKQAVITINLEAKQEPQKEAAGFTITVKAEIENKGTSNAFVDLSEEAPLKVALIKFDDNGKSSKELVLEQEDYERTSTVLRIGAIMRLYYFVKVYKPGLYLIDFASKLKGGEKKIDSLTRGSLQLPYWVGSTYIYIQ